MADIATLQAQLDGLDSQIQELADAIKAPEFEAINSTERERMRLQHHWMASHRQVLAERIAAMG